MLVKKICKLVLISLSILGCSGLVANSGAKNVMLNNLKTKDQSVKVITLKGTVKYLNFEGGFWGFEDLNGNKYMPSGLERKFLIDGLAIKLTGVIEENKGLMSFKQYGKALTVKTVKVIDKSNVRAGNTY